MREVTTKEMIMNAWFEDKAKYHLRDEAWRVWLMGYERGRLDEQHEGGERQRRWSEDFREVGEVSFNVLAELPEERLVDYLALDTLLQLLPGGVTDNPNTIVTLANVLPPYEWDVPPQLQDDQSRGEESGIRSQDRFKTPICEA